MQAVMGTQITTADSSRKASVPRTALTITIVSSGTAGDDTGCVGLAVEVIFSAKV